MNTSSSSQPFSSSRIVTVSSSCSTTFDNQNMNAMNTAATINNNYNNFHSINGSISTGSNSSTDLNQDQIFAPNAWWRSFGNSYSNANISTNFQQQEETQQYANLISMPTSGNVIQDSDSIIDWDNFFAPSCNSHEPKILTSIPSQQVSSTCKITINPNCTNSFGNSSSDSTTNFICNNNYSTTTTTTNATVTNNNVSNIDGMITLLNRILIMNGVNPASNQCQIPTISSSTYQHSNMETNPATFVTETANFNYAPIQSFDQMQTQPSNLLMNYSSIPSQSTHNTSFSTSSSSSDSDSTGSQHSNNSIGNKNKIAKKRTTRPRLKFQKEADKSIKFNLITSEELAATLQFHETLVPTSSGKRNRGRPKKSESSPQKPKAEQSTNIEFMVNCYDQCSKIFK